MGRAAVADAHYNYCRSHSLPSTSLEIRYCDNLDCLSRPGVEDRYEALRFYLAIRTCSVAVVVVAAAAAVFAALDCDAAQYEVVLVTRSPPVTLVGDSHTRSRRIRFDQFSRSPV